MRDRDIAIKVSQNQLAPMVNPWLCTMFISEAMFLQGSRKEAANILTHAVQETYE